MYEVKMEKEVNVARFDILNMFSYRISRNKIMQHFLGELNEFKPN